MDLASHGSGDLREKAAHLAGTCRPSFAVAIDDEGDMGHWRWRAVGSGWRTRLDPQCHRRRASASATDSANAHPMSASHVSCIDLFLW